jgi:hypothetical protein
VRVRLIASGVAIAALAGTAVPLALSGSAAAKGSGTPAPVAITKCSPAVATIGKTVTIHGTSLTGATKVTIGTKNVTASIKNNTAKAITIFPVPSGIAVTPNAATVKVTALSGSATNNTTCHFQKAKKKVKKH